MDNLESYDKTSSSETEEFLKGWEDSEGFFSRMDFVNYNDKMKEFEEK